MKKVSISIIILTIVLAFSSCQKKSSEKEILSFKFVSPVSSVYTQNGTTLVKVQTY